MSIISINTAIVKDHRKFADYVRSAASLMQKYNVEVLSRGNYHHNKKGPALDAHIMAIFRYKDIEAFKYFYSCEEYKMIIPLRNEACDMTIQVYSEQ